MSKPWWEGGEADLSHPEALEKIPIKSTRGKQPRSTAKEMRSAASLAIQLSSTMIICMLLGLFFGRYLDQKFNTSPVFLLTLTLLGGAASIKVLYDTVKRQWSNNNEKNK